MRRSNIPPVRRLSAKRMDKLRVIWREFSTKDLAEVVRKAAASDFLNERGRKHKFQATFDWLIEPENWSFIRDLLNSVNKMQFPGSRIFLSWFCVVTLQP